MNFLGLLNLDTEWKNQKGARMKCKLSFYIDPSFSWNDNWHLPLFSSGMKWCDSVGKKIPPKGLHSLSSRTNLNGWCYSIAHIWIWLTRTIVTHPFMTLTVKGKLKVLLCNLHVDFHLRFLHLMTSWHSVRFWGVARRSTIFRYLFQTKKPFVFFLWNMPNKFSTTN